MPRVSVSAGEVEYRTVVGPDGLTARQRDVIRLYFVEGMKMGQISTFLRYSLSTIEKEKAAALETLRTTEEELRQELRVQSGDIHLRIAIERGGDVAFPLDTTANEAHKVLVIPGYRSALYSPGLSASAVKEFHRQHPRATYNINEDPNFRAP